MLLNIIVIVDDSAARHVASNCIFEHCMLCYPSSISLLLFFKIKDYIKNRRNYCKRPPYRYLKTRMPKLNYIRDLVGV